MIPNCPVVQLSTTILNNLSFDGCCSNGDDSHNDNSNTEALSILDLIEIALYTIQKINNYPSAFGKTVENYFHLLFPDEIKAYLARRQINRRLIKGASFESGCSANSPNKTFGSQTKSAQVKQVRDIRNLCKLFVEQQEGVLTLISDMLDELEANLSDSDADEGGALNGK